MILKTRVSIRLAKMTVPWQNRVKYWNFVPYVIRLGIGLSENNWEKTSICPQCYSNNDTFHGLYDTSRARIFSGALQTYQVQMMSAPGWFLVPSCLLHCGN